MKKISKLFLVVILPGLLLLCSCAVNPVTQESQLALMSEEQEIQMGEKAYPQYTQLSYGLYQDQQLQDYVQAVGQRLARASHRPDLNYEFNVVNDSNINAYALPGGKISITRGLLSKMDNEAQLAGVLGHEIGHVAARHAVSGHARQVLAGVITSVAAIGLESAGVAGGDLLLQGGQLATNLVLMKYSRDQERQVDALGMDYMVQAGYNPEGMIGLTEILKGTGAHTPSQLEVMFSTHPPSEERYFAARQKAQTYSQSVRSRDRLYAEHFERQIAGLRKNEPAYELMDKGLKQAGEKNYAQALKYLDQAVSRAEDQAMILVMKALVENDAGKNKKAYTSAQRAVQIYPGLFYARYVAGLSSYDLKKHRQSLSQLSKANNILPEMPQVLFYTGLNHEALGQREDAARAYYKVLQKVQKGQMAEYCVKKLQKWGYLE